MDPLYPDDDSESFYQHASDLNLRESVNRRIRLLVQNAPVGCLSDRLYFATRWLEAVVNHCHYGADLPEGISLDHREQVGERLIQISNELGHRGFNVPAMPSWEGDPLGAIVAWHDYFKKISAHITSADQVEMDALIGSVTAKQ